MDTLPHRDLFCARCRYNLRGLTTQRCPECGLTFDDEQWQTGFLRENIPTWLDDCDPWQPHQVLIRSLWALVTGTLAPRRLFKTLNRNGALLPAGLALVGGTIWLSAFVTAVLVVATILHTNTSPGAALRLAVVLRAPRAMLISLLVGALVVGNLLHPRLIRVARLSWRDCVRIGGYGIPVAALYAMLPLWITLLVLPELTTPLALAWPPLLVLAAAAQRKRAAANDPATGGHRVRQWLMMLAQVGLLAALIRWVRFWPSALQPPLSVLF